MLFEHAVKANIKNNVRNNQLEVRNNQLELCNFLKFGRFYLKPFQKILSCQPLNFYALFQAVLISPLLSPHNLIYNICFKIFRFQLIEIISNRLQEQKTNSRLSKVHADLEQILFGFFHLLKQFFTTWFLYKCNLSYPYDVLEYYWKLKKKNNALFLLFP